MKNKKSSFQGKVAKASKKTAQQNSNYGYLNLPKGVNVFKPENDSRVTLDFLPYIVTMKNHPDKDEKDGTAVKDSIWYRLPFKTHRNVGTGTNQSSVVCPSSFGKKCPICEYKAKKVAEKADKEDIAALKTSPRYLYIVNPLDSSKFEKGKWHIFDISHAMFQKLLDDELDEGSVSEIFMDPTEGESLKVRFTGKTIGNSKPFPEATKITAVERAKPYADSISGETPKLDEILVVLTYEELEKKFFELEDEEEDDDEPRAKKSNKKAVVEEDEDEDDEQSAPVKKSTKKVPVIEEDEDDEDDDEPIAPTRKKKVEPASVKKSKKPPVVEDEDDEDDEEEADETLTWDDLLKMKDVGLREIIKAEELNMDADDFEDDIKALRKAVAKELGIKIPKTVSTPEKEKSGNKCPSGFRFGIDTDKKDECNACDLWDDCMEAKKKNKK